MIKIRVHLESRYDLDLEEENTIIIELPSVPRAGEIVHISEDQRNELREKIIQSGQAEYYYPLWFWGKWREPGRAFKPEAIEHFDFEDAMYVKYVWYKAYSKSVHMILSGDSNAHLKTT